MSDPAAAVCAADRIRRTSAGRSPMTRAPIARCDHARGSTSAVVDVRPRERRHGVRATDAHDGAAVPRARNAEAAKVLDRVELREERIRVEGLVELAGDVALRAVEDEPGVGAEIEK